MAQAIGKEKVKGMLKVLYCETINDAWQKSKPLDDEGAARIEALAEEFEGIPRLRELDGYLLLDTGDGETIVVFRDASGTRREVMRQILSAMPMGDPGTGGDYLDREMGAWEDIEPVEVPDYEPVYE